MLKMPRHEFHNDRKITGLQETRSEYTLSVEQRKYTSIAEAPKERHRKACVWGGMRRL
jgi:hypothetical protein